MPFITIWTAGEGGGDKITSKIESAVGALSIWTAIVACRYPKHNFSSAIAES